MPNATYEASLAVLCNIVKKLEMEELNNNQQADATEVLGKILEVVVEEADANQTGVGKQAQEATRNKSCRQRHLLGD